MWMMGFNEGGEFNMTDSFNGRKLRPLMPRQASASNNPSVLSGVTEGDVLALNHHHLGMVGDQLRREFNSQQVVVSSRWNPTPEQLQTLEELYRRGTRTPSAEQIQHITSQLRRYGKIEGKNVFYWFQNHKARERQKRRRQLESHPEDNSRDTERKETGTNRTGFEVELTKIWASPSSTNCTTTVPERNVSTQKAAKARVPEYRTDGWAQFNEGESQQIRRNGTWQTMLMSYSPPTHLIDSITTTTHTTATLRMGDPLLIKSPDLNIFVAPPYTEDLNYWLSVSDNSVDDGDESRTLQLLDGRDESQTLQLFPLRNNDGDSNNTDKETEISVEDHMNSSFTPCQFFEFLPLRT